MNERGASIEIQIEISAAEIDAAGKEICDFEYDFDTSYDISIAPSREVTMAKRLPDEELYDIVNDSHEINNLASSI